MKIELCFNQNMLSNTHSIIVVIRILMMDVISERLLTTDRAAAKVIETILNMTEHNPVTLSDILGVSLKKLVLKKGFTMDEVSMILNLGNSLSIN